MQLLLTATMAMLAARVFHFEWTESLFVGFLTALSSTAVVMKLLQERSELTTHYGKTIVGILIFQDIILIPLLLFTPMLGGATADVGHDLLILMLKTSGIMFFIWVGTKWLMPWLLHLIAMTRSQELFLMSLLLICLAVAMLTHQLGMSLAFGAFLAGLMISDTEYSHSAFGNLIPFKDVFTSFFFVSIGMLLDLGFVAEHPWLVIGTVLLVIVLKAFVAGMTAFSLGHTFFGTVVVGLSLAQVGEFSFILAGLGLMHNIITPYHYQLFLAVAITSMALSPLMIQISRPLANLMLRLPLPPRIVNGLFPLKQVEIPEISNHTVLIGKDSRAINLASMIKTMGLPFTSIVFDPDLARREMEKGNLTVFGDATFEPVLREAFAHTAELIVISVGNLITALSIVEHIRKMNKHAHIIVRTRHVTDIEELYKLGASQVIPEEFETAIDFFERILGKYLIPRMDIERAIARTREDNYGIFRDRTKVGGYSLLKDIPDIEIAAARVGEESVFSGKTIAQTAMRKTAGVTIVAINHDGRITANPDPSSVILGNDIIYLLGKPEMIALAINILSEPRPE
jgi:CPA2 family monovalent cation:H+ antiporter-2